MNDGQSAKKIITSTNLQGFFFEGLLELNRKIICPVPESILYYSSDVLGKFALTQNFFEVQDGKVREKILGTKILEAAQMNKEDQRRTYKEVADTSLILCGYFSESVNNKLVDTHYYAQLGMMAYEQLNTIAPSFLDIPSFYHMIATSFGPVTNLMGMLASSNRAGCERDVLLKRVLSDQVSEKDMLIAGINPATSKKVS